jgi:hypothetical protein
MTAATTTQSPSRTRHGRIPWTGPALMAVGALLGVAATMVISDDDEAPARTVSADASFQGVSAADIHPSADAAEQWAATDPYLRPGAYAHGFSYADADTDPYLRPGAYAHGFNYAELAG